MGITIYILLGVLWVAACLVLGMYITARSLSGRKHYRTGLKTILISYLLGLCMLLTAVMIF